MVLTNNHDVALRDTIAERITMTELSIDPNEEDCLSYEIPDEALEGAGGRPIAGNFTLGACTGLSECPG